LGFVDAIVVFVFEETDAAFAGLFLELLVEVEAGGFGDEEAAAVVEGGKHGEGGLLGADFLDGEACGGFGGGGEAEEKQPQRHGGTEARAQLEDRVGRATLFCFGFQLQIVNCKSQIIFRRCRRVC
jgi:hypothetical protein